MRKLLLAGLATAVLALPSGAVLAQSYDNGYSAYPGGDDRYDDGRYDAYSRYGEDRDDEDERTDDRYAGHADDDAWRPYDQADAEDLQDNAWYAHVRICEARYASYDPRTDRYLVRRGVWARCRL